MTKTAENTGRIVKVSGPLIIAENMAECKMYDVVRVGEQRLIGEIIELRGDLASIQVYEETAGLGPGENVYTTGVPLSAELGPGLIGGIFDGIQRPLDGLKAKTGDRIARGVDMPSLDREKKWPFVPAVKKGDPVRTGDVLGTVRENEVVLHRILVPHGVEGTVSDVRKGSFRVEDTVAVVKTETGERELCMLTRWPVRIGRPYGEKIAPFEPMLSGQRSVDTLFPIARGGVAAVPGPFGSGKTVVQHQLAKWADADIVVYIGCGERGNEMTDVLKEFPELKDPKSGESLMKRTILIANTSDMPVAAREASIYTGITIAEYFRDMGYNVAVMADSTSRWAEALREMSGRLEEMPGEEGYPAYLSSRLAEFYERAGVVRTLGSEGRSGSVTAIGAVSPPGGDLSEPVSQSTLRIVKVFWGLSASLAYKRHFPAIDWLQSYSLYADRLTEWYGDNIGDEWIVMRARILSVLQDEAKLEEIVRLVGSDALSPEERWIMETAKSVREDYLQQDAFHDVDAHTSLEKMFEMMKIILERHDLGMDALSKGVDVEDLIAMPVGEKIARSKYIPEDNLSAFGELERLLKEQILSLTSEGGE